ncbi:MAG: VWA domain-containing protein [Defluviitaleaceae bacterium]|nr:VWA domain-containing protein [Defluviitaleaceae bacterium]
MRKFLLAAAILTLLFTTTAYGELLPIDAVLVLDVSRSMRTADPERVSRDAMNLFIDMLSEGRDRVGVVAYAGQVERSVGLVELKTAEDRDFLRDFINGLEYASWTDHGVGLREAVEMFVRDESEARDENDETNESDEARQGIILFLTDGNMNVNPWDVRTNEDAREDVFISIYEARARNIPIHAIGLNFDGNLDMQYVENVAAETGGLAFETADAADIYEIIRAFFGEMIAAAMPEPEPTPEPTPVPTPEPTPEPAPLPPEEEPTMGPLGPAIAAGSVVFFGGAVFLLAKKPRRVFTGKLQIETRGKKEIRSKNLIEYGNRVTLGTLIQSERRELQDVIFLPSPGAPSHLPQLQIKCKNPKVKFTKDFLPRDISRGITLSIGNEAAFETETELVKIKYIQ